LGDSQGILQVLFAAMAGHHHSQGVFGESTTANDTNYCGIDAAAQSEYHAAAIGLLCPFFNPGHESLG
jgi:hypothetical protein